jgi:type IV secretion system protein VirB4
MLLHRNSPKGERDLTRFLSNLQDKELREALEYYTLSGCMGKLVDSAKDDLQDSRFQTFEIEELMNMGNENALPVLLYLFRCIEKSLDGSPTVIFIDEAWMVLGHPVFAAKVREWLKVLRKANCCVVLATQSLSDAAKSGIMDVLIEACPTKLYLPNPDAMQEDASALYRSMGLNDRQIQLLAEATKKRDYYFSSPEGRRMFRLNLGRIALAFTATSGKETLAKIRNLCAQHGEEWPEAWLKENNIEIPINENN